MIQKEGVENFLQKGGKNMSKKSLQLEEMLQRIRVEISRYTC